MNAKIYNDRSDFVSEIESCLKEVGKIMHRIDAAFYIKPLGLLDDNFENISNANLDEAWDYLNHASTSLCGIVGKHYEIKAYEENIKPNPSKKK